MWSQTFYELESVLGPSYILQGVFITMENSITIWTIEKHQASVNCNYKTFTK